MKRYKIKDFLLPFIKRHWLLTILLSILIIFCAVSELLPSYALKYLIDDYLAVNIKNENINTTTLILISLLYFGSYALVSVFTILENIAIDSFGQKMIHELRYEMLMKTTRLKSTYFTHHGTGEMTSKIADDVNAIETLFASGLVSLIVSLFKVLGILISIFVFSWTLGLILLFFIPVLYIITRTFQKQMLRNQLINRKAINGLNNHLSETADNILTIRNLNGEKYREKGFESLLLDSYHSLNKSAVFDSIYSPIIQMMKAIVISLVCILVSYGENNVDNVLSLGITVGTFSAALSLISNLFSPIENIGQELQSMQEGVSGVKRVEDFLSEDEIPEKDLSIKANDLIDADELISVKNLSFHYDDSDELIFSDVSFEIYRNDKVTIIGRTGAGKTTLFRLLIGVLVPTSGNIYIGKVDSYRIPDDEKRKVYGYVEQGFSSINGSILEQITLKDKNISINKVRESMRKVNLDSYVIDNIKGGYNAKFKEEYFSRGQLQLLSLARALVYDPKILLLDEISANLDSETEKDILNVLSKESENKTVISISHRLSDSLGFSKTIEVRDGEVIVHS